MGNKPVTTDISAGSQYKASVLNANLAILETAIEGCLGRGGTSENPNSMQGDLDMNNNDILNVGDLTVDGVSLTTAIAVTSANAVLTSIDAGQTALDAFATAADRVQTGLDAVKAEQWAEEDEDVVVEAGQYSSKHWAAKAADYVSLGGIEAATPSTIPLRTATGALNVANASADVHAVNRQTGDGRYLLAAGNTDVIATNYTKGTLAMYACRAWVNFDATTTPPTIRASENVSSVSRTSTGLFTVNFTNAMPDLNYATNYTVGFGNTSTISSANPATTSSVDLIAAENGTVQNPLQNCVSVFR